MSSRSIASDTACRTSSRSNGGRSLCSSRYETLAPGLERTWRPARPSSAGKSAGEIALGATSLLPASRRSARAFSSRTLRTTIACSGFGNRPVSAGTSETTPGVALSTWYGPRPSSGPSTEAHLEIGEQCGARLGQANLHSPRRALAARADRAHDGAVWAAELGVGERPDRGAHVADAERPPAVEAQARPELELERALVSIAPGASGEWDRAQRGRFEPHQARVHEPRHLDVEGARRKSGIERGDLDRDHDLERPLGSGLRGRAGRGARGEQRQGDAREGHSAQ